MNEWIKKSIELAFGEFYLDNLLEIYPPYEISRGLVVDDETKKLKELYNCQKANEFLKELIRLKKKGFKFPVDHPYISFLSYSDDAIKNNPKTVEEICKVLFKIKYDDLKQKLEAPKKASRKMGPMFKDWLVKNFHFANLEDIKKSNSITFLKGSDAVLKEFAEQELKCKFGKLSKGLDFIAKAKNDYLVGTAKFITDFGGTQYNQFYEAVRLIRESSVPENIKKVAIIDGVAWLGKSNRMAKEIQKIKDDEFCFSALLLKDFLNKI